jgi:site-specific DNA-adenine methylase
MPVPYLGSKRKSAQQIFSIIKNFTRDNNSNTFVDLFCGGFAVSEIFLRNGYDLIANDKNKYVIALIEKTISGNLDEAKCLEWISRDKFIDVMNSPSQYEDWYVGYVMCVWSFGNNSPKGYLFGKDTEPIKQAGHELVVNKDQTLIEKLDLKIPQVYIDGILQQKDWHARRIALVKVSKKLKTRVLELQRLEQLQQLQQLERLQQLEQLEQHSNIVFSSTDYRSVDIPDNAIVYCDPPYKGTAEYSEGNFNHEEFWQWARGKSKTNKVFISEYNAPDDFEYIYAFPQKSTLQGGNQKHTNQPKEKIFRLKGVA